MVELGLGSSPIQLYYNEIMYWQLDNVYFGGRAMSTDFFGRRAELRSCSDMYQNCLLEVYQNFFQLR